MTLADRIYQKVKPLPEPLAREVLDFVDFLSKRSANAETDNLIHAQAHAQAVKDWDNPDDEIWNDRPAV